MKSKLTLLLLMVLILSMIPISVQPVRSDPTNLAVIPTDWDLNGYYPTDTSTRYVFLDTSVLHNGDVSIRLDPTSYPDRATWITDRANVVPGDIVTASIWIKTGSGPSGWGGGRIGVDMWSSTGQYGAGVSANFNGSVATFPQDKTAEANNFVAFGSDWTYRTISFIVPSTITMDEDGNPHSPVVPAQITMWVQVMYHDDAASAWFADAELYVNPPGNQYHLTVNTPVNGAINQTSGLFANGTKVGLLATPNSNYAFLNWQIDGVNSTSNPTSILMTANHTVSAYFNLKQYYLTIITDGNEAVNRSSAWFTNGTAVGILATPNLNYHFTNFTVDGSLITSNPTSILMTANHTVRVYSSLNQYYLTINTPANGAINQTSAWFSNVTKAGLLATPNLNYAFSNWVIDGVNYTANPISITMNQNHTVSAYFQDLATNLAVIPTDWSLNGAYPTDTSTRYVFLDTSVLHNGDVSIRLDPTSYPDRATWAGRFDVKPGDLIVASIWIKTGSGGSGHGARIGVDMWSSTGQFGAGISEDFNGGLPTLPLDSAGVTKNYIPFGSDWQERTISFTVPSVITVDENGNHHSPVVPAQISLWVQVMNPNTPASAWFADAQLYVEDPSGPLYVPLGNQYYLTVNSPANGKINQTSGFFANGTKVSLLATPNSNCTFSNWAIDGVNYTDNPISITMTQNHTVSAYFQDPVADVTQNVQYSVANSVSLPANVTLMYANGAGDATLSNSPTWVSGDGVHFNGSNQKMVMPTTLTQNFKQKTVLMWVACASPMQPQDLYYGCSSGSSYGDAIYYATSNQLRTYLRNSAGTALTITTTLNTPTSLNLVGYTWDGSNAWNIINNTFNTKTAFTGTLACNASTLDIDYGAYRAYGNNTVYGFYVINGNLTQAQLNAIYNAGPKAFQYVPGLVLYYGFNEGSGNCVYGYDAFANFTSQGSTKSLSISHHAGGVNSSLYWGVNNFASTFPYNNGTYTWNLASGNVTHWRVNSSGTQTLYLPGTVSQYYLAVIMDGHETVNQSSAWFTYGTKVGILATPNNNYQFTNFTVDGILVTSNPTSVLMTGNHTVRVYSSYK